MNIEEMERLKAKLYCDIYFTVFKADMSFLESASDSEKFMH